MANSSQKSKSKKTMPGQKQNRRPGYEKKMTPKPEFEGYEYKASNRLEGKVAIVTGGDSGIGRSVAVLFAREGADVVISYLSEVTDAETTRDHIEQFGRKCILVKGDIGREAHARKVVDTCIRKFGRLDILVNNAAEQSPQKSIEDITEKQLVATFRTNIFAQFFMVKAALKHMKKGSAIINTTSVTAYRGSPELLDYSSTKGAIVSFTRSLAVALADKQIRVNAVAPGPIWTPLIPSTFPKQKVETFGGNVPLARPGQPDEVSPAFVYLASNDSSYMTGQVLHVNGGEIVNG